MLNGYPYAKKCHGIELTIAKTVEHPGLIIQLIQKRLPLKIQNPNSKIQSMRSKYFAIGVKCKHISWKYTPLNRKHLLVQYIS